MKNGYTLHDETTAQAGLGEVFEAVKGEFGFVPNMFRVIGEATPAARAYLELNQLFGQTSLSPIEQQVVLQAINVENACHYCVAAHSVVSTMVEMPREHINALRSGQSLDDPKLESLRSFASIMTRKRGNVSKEEFDAFIGVGWTKQTAMEVVLGLALKTLSNYANHLAGTPVDEQFASEAWEPGELVSA